MENAIDGIILVDKKEGETSYNVVDKIKRSFRRFSVGKVGHSGTLDPFATGLLVILLGQGSKLSRFIMSEPKVYLATMTLGIETDTLDPTGRVVQTMRVPSLRSEYIHEIAREFTGEMEQVPPVYSAVKYNGIRAYKLARKGLEPRLKKRVVTIYYIQILSIDLPDITMEIRCSSGTYIRGIAADLGKKLGPGGHLKSLRRLANGPFKVESAIRSEELLSSTGLSMLRDNLLNLSDSIPQMKGIEVDDRLEKKVRQGYQPAWDELIKDLDVTTFKDSHFKLIRGGELIAIAKIKRGDNATQDSVKIVRVFS